MDQCGRKLENWDNLVKKAINVVAKASLQPPSILAWNGSALAPEEIVPLTLPWLIFRPLTLGTLMMINPKKLRSPHIPHTLPYAPSQPRPPIRSIGGRRKSTTSARSRPERTLAQALPLLSVSKRPAPPAELERTQAGPPATTATRRCIS